MHTQMKCSSPSCAPMASANVASHLPILAMFGDAVCTTDVLLQPHNDFPIHPFAHAVIDPDAGEAMECWDLLNNPKPRLIWTCSATNESGCLAQGVGKCITGTDTLQFINYKISHLINQATTLRPALFMNYNHRKKKLNAPVSWLGATSLTALAK